jgi:hypothetical protein
MAKQEPWFIRERAEAFASLVLTEHHDVKVRPYAGTDMSIDLLVDVLEAGKSNARMFLVQLSNHLDLPDRQEWDKMVFSHLGRNPFEREHPICVFLIGVRKPEGYYRWVTEPVVHDGRATLNRDGERTWHPLDEKGLARLIEQVNAWYDARRENENGPGQVSMDNFT